MLKLLNVEVMYHNVIMVLRGISLEVTEGQIVTILGANGAGKTTSLKAISGLLKTEEGRVTAGTIEFDGEHIENGDPEKISRTGIVQVMEGRRVFEHLTIQENILTGAYMIRDYRKVSKEGLDMVYGYFPALKKLRTTIAGYASGGEQQMAVVGRALMTRPKIMLLDEPSLGLSPILVQEIYKILQRINWEQKLSVLLVEQNAVAALGIAQYGYVMETGRIVLDGPSEKLRNNEDIREFYLGLSELGVRKGYRDVKHYKRRKRWL